MKSSAPPPVSFETEGIRYTGSKRAIIPKIHELIHALPIRSTLDAFAGTTRVSQYLKAAGYDVHTNDLAPYSEVFGRCYIQNCDVARPESGRKNPAPEPVEARGRIFHQKISAVKTTGPAR